MDYDITPDMTDEIMDDPTRLPKRLQTPEMKARLLREVNSKRRHERSLAVTQLAGWDPDPEVEAILRERLSASDPVERQLAATGLARQRDTSSLDAVLDLVHKESPASGGDIGSMLLLLQSALELAALAGPDEVDRVKSAAREWRGARPARRRSWTGSSTDCSPRTRSRSS